MAKGQMTQQAKRNEGESFQVTWGVEDGYVGHRPHKFSIRATELEEDMGDEEIKSLFCESLRDEFEQTISYFSGDEEEFITWAKEQLVARSKETDDDN